MITRWLLVALVALAILLPSGLSVPIAASVVLIVGASRWWVGRVAAGLDVTCTAPSWISADEATEADVHVGNATRLPAPWLEIDVPCGLGLGRHRPHREAVMLAPGGTWACRVSVEGRRRGRHRIGPIRVRLGDVLGISDIHVETAATASITVFPRVVPIERLGLPANSPFVTIPAHRSLLADRTSVVGVRDYAPGDASTALHWPATARSARMMVKQYERAESRDTLVCLDLSSSGYPRGGLQAGVELAVTVAASVTHHCIVRNRLPVGLVTGTWEPRSSSDVIRLAPRADMIHLRRVLELLAVVESGAPITFSQMLSGLEQGLGAGTTILAVTGVLTNDVSVALLRLARAGLSVAVALSGPTTVHDSMSVGQLWLPVYRIVDPTQVTRLAS